MSIYTNNIPRPTLSWWQLTPEELKEFDYGNLDEMEFVRYRGVVYDLCNMVKSNVRGWDSMEVDTAFSAVLVRFNPEEDTVVMGTLIL